MNSPSAKKIIQTSILFCFCLSLTPSGFSQIKNFTKGFVILPEGDTLKGHIKNMPPIDRSELVVFKKDADSDKVTYHPGEISQYYFEGSNYYISDSVVLKNSNSDPNDSRFRSYKTVFLKKLVEGKIELFRLDYQLIENQPAFYDYVNKFYYIRQKESEILIDLHEDDYRLKLTQIFNDSDCAFEKNTRHRFRDDDLSNLIALYNQCIGSSSTSFVVKRAKTEKLKVGLGVGITSTGIHTDNKAFSNFEFTNQIGYDINLLLYQKIWKWISLRGGVNFKHRKQDGFREVLVSEFYENEGDIVTMKSNLTLNQMGAPLQLLASYNIGKVSPYIFGGVYIGIEIKNSAYLDNQGFTTGSPKNTLIARRDDRPYNVKINPIETGWSAGAGIEYQLNAIRSVFLECQFYRGNNDSPPGSRPYISQEAIIAVAGITL